MGDVTPLIGVPLGIGVSIILIVVLTYFDDRDPEHLEFVKRRLSNGVCDGGPSSCKYGDTIESMSCGCRKPPFEKCEYNVTPEEYFGDAKTKQEWRESIKSQQLRNKSQSKKGPRVLASSESG